MAGFLGITFGLFVQRHYFVQCKIFWSTFYGAFWTENQEPFPGSVLQVAYLEAGKKAGFFKYQRYSKAA